MDVHFNSNYDKKELFLIEAPQTIINKLKESSQLEIKGDKSHSVICTGDSSFSMKYVYTTNNFYVISKENEEKKLFVNLIADHTVELQDYLPMRSKVFKALKQNSLSYNKFTGINNMKGNNLVLCF